MFIPEFTILIDKREQLPYAFESIPFRDKETVAIRRKFGTLPSGDYSIEGMENRIAIERKSLEDLFGTLTGGRKRFLRELERLRNFEFSAVVIEASLFDVLHPEQVRTDWYSQATPFSVFRSITSWSVQFPTRWYCCSSRKGAESVTFHLLYDFYHHFSKKETEP